MPRRKMSGEATHQEAPGATIVHRDDATYARQHAGFSLIDAAQIFPTRTEQLPTVWTGIGSLWPFASEWHVVLHRRPQCGQQLLPRLRRRLVRACSDDLTIECQRRETRTGFPVPNRPPKRDSFIASLGATLD